MHVGVFTFERIRVDHTEPYYSQGAATRQGPRKTLRPLRRSGQRGASRADSVALVGARALRRRPRCRNHNLHAIGASTRLTG